MEDPGRAAASIIDRACPGDGFVAISERCAGRARAVTYQKVLDIADTPAWKLILDEIEGTQVRPGAWTCQVMVDRLFSGDDLRMSKCQIQATGPLTLQQVGMAAIVHGAGSTEEDAWGLVALSYIKGFWSGDPVPAGPQQLGEIWRRAEVVADGAAGRLCDRQKVHIPYYKGGEDNVLQERVLSVDAIRNLGPTGRSKHLSEMALVEIEGRTEGQWISDGSRKVHFEGGNLIVGGRRYYETQSDVNWSYFGDARNGAGIRVERSAVLKLQTQP